MAFSCTCTTKKVIADIPDNTGYTTEEVGIRNKLACLYQLFDRFGWTEGIYTHTSARVTESEFLLNPYGANMFEITASSLVKITMEGNVVDRGSLNLGANDAGFNLHSGILEAFPEVNCVIHLHPMDVIAVSGMKCGLLPISQDGMSVMPMSYHDYEGIVTDPAEQERFVRDWLPGSHVMILRNHGLLTIGSTIEEAFFYLFWTVQACTAQVRAMRGGLDNLLIPSEAIQKKYYEEFLGGAEKINRGADESKEKTGFAEMDWAAYMRLLQKEGYVTGQEKQCALGPATNGTCHKLANGI